MKIYNKIVFDIATEKVIDVESFDYNGEVALCGPAAAILPMLGEAGGMLGTVGSAVGTGLSVMSAADQLFGPKGALVTGDISKGMSAANTLGSATQGITDWWNKSSVPKTPTTMSTMGLSPEQFKSVDPGTGSKLLGRATQGGFSGDDTEAFGLSPDEFNQIPLEVRQELLRKLAGR